LTVGQLKPFRMSELGTYHGASTIMRKTLDWNRSRISMLEVEANEFVIKMVILAVFYLIVMTSSV
jgi:hypothetical protein